MSDENRSTESKEKESLERQSHKMGELGRLVVGITHDFNNLLTAITGWAQLAFESVPEGPGGDATRECINGVLSSAQKATNLTQHLRAYYGRQVLNPQVLSINLGLTEMVEHLRRILGDSSIELKADLSSDPCFVKIDPVQLEQVVVNLVVNARDAITAPGVVTIKTKQVNLREMSSDIMNLPIPPGRYVTLTVTDTGCGISLETLPKIFEPFFTTKEGGKGTGMGLGTVYSILKQNLSYIQVESVVGKGSTFKIYFPSAEPTAEQTSEEVLQTTGETKGKGTILLVDDSPEVRKSTQLILEWGGYNVLVASRPTEAIEQCFTASKIDLLITDYDMPEMNGYEMVQRFIATRPIKVLYISGHPSTTSRIPEKELDHFLSKPYSHKALLAKIKEVLES